MDYEKEYKKQLKETEKYHLYYSICNLWLLLKQEGKKISTYFNKKNYKTVAIYGYKEIGERLYFDLTNEGIDVACIIDKAPQTCFAPIDVFSPDEAFPKFDVLVVTVSPYFDEIYDVMSKKVDCPILCLEDILFTL